MTAMEALMPEHSRITRQSDTEKSGRMLEVFGEIATERVRQFNLLRRGKILFTLDSAMVDDDRKLRICTEELGEIAGAIDKLEGSPRAQRRKGDLRKEIIQLAACCVAWLETSEMKP